MKAEIEDNSMDQVLDKLATLEIKLVNERNSATSYKTKYESIKIEFNEKEKDIILLKGKLFDLENNAQNTKEPERKESASISEDKSSESSHPQKTRLEYRKQPSSFNRGNTIHSSGNQIQS